MCTTTTSVLMRIAGTLRLFPLLLAALACGETPLEPGAVTGRWALARVAERPLPTVLLNEAEADVLLAADTLALGSDGSFTGTNCELRVERPEPSASITCRPYQGVYTVRVRTVELRRLCALSANCLGGPSASGTMRSDRLLLRAGVDAPLLEYVRVE